MTENTTEDSGARGRDAAAASAGDTPADLAARFRDTWAGEGDPETRSGELLPARLARACAAVLAVDGVGLSLMDKEFRVPLGASDRMATVAEELQFTQGEGPCLSSARDQRVFIGGPEQVWGRWPLFAQELYDRTPFRAVVSLPTRLRPEVAGAIDLFFTEPDRAFELRLADAITVSEQIVEALQFAEDIAGDPDAASEGPAGAGWLRAPAAERRRQVWVAAGIVMAQLHLTATDAVSLLRSHAYAEGRDLDAIADDVVHRRFDARELRLDTP